MEIVPHFPTSLFTLPPLLPAPKPKLMLPAPQIAGYLPAPATLTIVTAAPHKTKRRVVVAEIVNPLDLIDIRRDPDAWWEEFERIHGKIKTIEELDAEIEAEHPGYLAWAARMKEYQQAKAEAAAS